MPDVSLKPCPFCGSKNLRVYTNNVCAGHGDFYEAYSVLCSDCKASGGTAVVPYDFRCSDDAIAKAIERWNVRNNFKKGDLL